MTTTPPQAPSRDAGALAAQFASDSEDEFESSQRGWSFLFPVVAIMLGVPFMCLLPGATEVTGLTFGNTMLGMAPVAAIMLLTTAVYERWGAHSAAFRFWDVTETFAMQSGIGFVIVSSGRGYSVFWVFYVVHWLQFSVHRFDIFLALPIFSMPLFVTAWFIVTTGFSTDAAFPMLMLLMGVALYGHFSRYQNRIRRLVNSGRALELEVARLRLEAERRRIARDLHDGLAADLTAIAWRAEHLSLTAASPASAADLDALGVRARAAIEETRSLVWTLRGQASTWAQVLEHLRVRVHDLCGVRVAAELSFEDASIELSADVVVDVVRIIQEGLRNALQHGGATRVRVSASAGEVIRLSVWNDGDPLPEGAAESSGGGLKNIRERVELRGGEMKIGSADAGTLLEATVPLKLGRGCAPRDA